ncbi:hypothetical protein LP419_13000 [Massilia sp. H-1]|nr:hypothetical protein LP419_13000 [Massilia sp. H-1]
MRLLEWPARRRTAAARPASADGGDGAGADNVSITLAAPVVTRLQAVLRERRA